MNEQRPDLAGEGDPGLAARLLSGQNRLSRPEKDEILAAVLADVLPARRRRWRWLPVGGLAGAAVAAALLLVVVRGGSEPAQEFASRGTARATAALTITCTGALPAPQCQQGEQLLFDLQGTREYDYFAAFARRNDGLVIWYLPDSETGTSLELAAHVRDGVLDRSVTLGVEHSSGRYEIYGVFSSLPLSRAQLRERIKAVVSADGAMHSPEFAVVIKELVVP